MRAKIRQLTQQNQAHESHETFRPDAFRALENSAAEFAENYAQYAAQGAIHPSIEGSPLIEFAAAGRVFYLFDRNPPYTMSTGPAHMLIHGILDLDYLAEQATPNHPNKKAEKEAELEGEWLNVCEVSILEGHGQIIHTSTHTHHHVWVIHARVPLVLAAFEELPHVDTGDWVHFRTLAPLHGFLISADSLNDNNPQ